MTLTEKMLAALTADDDHIYEAVGKMTDAQKDIALVTLIRVLRGEKPEGWDEIKKIIEE